MLVPTLLINTSSLPPNRVSISRLSISLPSGVDTSATTPCTSRPCWSLHSCSLSVSSFWLREQVKTVHPSDDSWVTMAEPMPLVPPVTTAVLDFNSYLSELVRDNMKWSQHEFQYKIKLTQNPAGGGGTTLFSLPAATLQIQSRMRERKPGLNQTVDWNNIMV